MMSKSLSRIVVLGMAGIFLTGHAFAQAGMAEDERSVVAIGAPGYVDERNGNGVLYHSGAWSASPLTYNYSHHGTAAGDGVAYGDISASNYVNYGYLSVAASGDSQSSNLDGTFSWAQTFIGGDITTGFHDDITVTQTMTVSYRYRVDAANSIVANSDGYTGSSVATYIQFGSVNVNDAITGNGVTTYQGTITLNPGTYALLVGLGYNSSSNSNDLSTLFSSFSTSAIGTFNLWSDTSGVNFSTLSGHNYSAVPEPSAILVLAGVLPVCLLRRNRARS